MDSFKISLIDMNNGLENQAIRCFHDIINNFSQRAKESNPNLKIELEVTSPRDKCEIAGDSHLYLSTGGPGSPWDGEDSEWEKQYFNLINKINSDNQKFLLAVCHSFQLVTRCFDAGEVRKRPEGRKFGVMPIYLTALGESSELLNGFGDRLFAFEHRDWEVVNLNPKYNPLARESRDGVSKGEAVLAIDFGNGIEGVQFHPEADVEGILKWINKEEKKKEFIDHYGEEVYQVMMKTLNRKDRVQLTRDKIIPGWLERKFNLLASNYGWNKI